MNYNDLSDEAKETLKGMVEYCINYGICMGMDEGIDYSNDEDGEPHQFRKELEAFCEYR